MVHTFTREQFLEHPLEEVFAFHADAANLERITPPWLGFRILTPMPLEMRAGARIDYRIRLRGLPVTWRTEIVAWDPPRTFTDVQRRGPYRRWEHTHTFIAVPGGTLISDVVHYELPAGTLGERLLRWFVAREISRIFEYRGAALTEVFGAVSSPGTAGSRAPRSPSRSR
jgi:ligand-binding SRPBCC domain-containing protein